MRKLILILFFALLTTGCGSTLKKSWTNFRAYYNTYYNAEENFRTGLNKVEQQPVTLDPAMPVRMHLPPVQAGNEDFKQAIDKGAQILRKFPDSKWADDALLLIGKSYYYQQEFYSALEKFEELQNVAPAPEMEQKAIIWKGQTLLDLEQYSDGVSYLETELDKYPPDWSRQRKGEIEALAAEHHAMLENWDQAAELLSEALTGIEDKQLLGRTFFLYGQMLERLERYGEAQYTYSQVGANFPGFEYAYWAKIKQAEVARKEGNLNLALSIYDNLWKDDKNLERRDEIAFEMAQTLEIKGQIEEAEKEYKSLLYNSQGTQKRSLKSAIYYRLGKINSEKYNNYNLAAAYFDSSSSLMSAQNSQEETQDAQSLSDAFGNYTKYQETIQRADSLLWLGSLPKTELDSVLEVIRRKQRQELLAQQEERSGNTLANRNLQPRENNQTTSSSVYGFLNHQNAELANQAKTEFRIIWGARPLVDNWRRLEAVQQTNEDGALQSEEISQQPSFQDPASEALDMDLTEIPRTSKAKKALKAQKEKAQFELGNLLFLNMNLPDSARYYFHRVIHSNVDRELRPRAMYSLYELFNTDNNQDSLQYWGDRILDEYPDTKYARRIRGKANKSAVNDEPSDSSQKILNKYRQINSSPEVHKGAKLRSLALTNRSSEIAPYIHYQAIERYVGEAKTHHQTADSLQPAAIVLLPDSLQTTGISSDSTSGDSTLSDSTRISIEDRLNFRGAYWDSVRILLQEFDTTFTNSSQHDRVTALREILDQPENSTESTEMPTCKSLDITLSVQPGMDEFLSTVTYPEEIANQTLSGEVTYSFVVNSEGEFESYELVSNRTSLGIEDSFEKAFEESLKFAPLTVENAPPKLRCEVTFPIQQ